MATAASDRTIRGISANLFLELHRECCSSRAFAFIRVIDSNHASAHRRTGRSMAIFADPKRLCRASNPLASAEYSYEFAVGRTQYLGQRWILRSVQTAHDGLCQTATPSPSGASEPGSWLGPPGGTSSGIGDPHQMKPPSAIWRTVLFPPCFLDCAGVDPLRRVVRALRWGMPTQAVDECRRVGSSPGRFSCWSPLTRGHFEVSMSCVPSTSALGNRQRAS